MSKKKPVVAFKAARSRPGRHGFGVPYRLSGRLAPGRRRSLHQAGIVSVDSIDELVAAAKSLAMQPCSAGPSVGLISNGAGAFVQAIDLLDSYGLEMPTLSRETAAALRAVYPPYYLVQNPIDVTGSATSEDYEKGITRAARGPRRRHRDAVVRLPELPPGRGIVEAMERMNTGDKPIVCGAMGGPYTKKMSGRDRGRRGTRLPFHPRLGGSCLRSVPRNSLRYHLATGLTYHRCQRSSGSWLGTISQPAARARSRKATVSSTFGQIDPTTSTFENRDTMSPQRQTAFSDVSTITD